MEFFVADTFVLFYVFILYFIFLCRFVLYVDSNTSVRVGEGKFILTINRAVFLIQRARRDLMRAVNMTRAIRRGGP